LPSGFILNSSEEIAFNQKKAKKHSKMLNHKKDEKFESVSMSPTLLKSEKLSAPNGSISSSNCSNDLLNSIRNKNFNDSKLSLSKRSLFKTISSNSTASIITHFSPQTSLRIRVIDEMDGDY
jgi:hypothetical protein